jgi:hypothetical protein
MRLSGWLLQQPHLRWNPDRSLRLQACQLKHLIQTRSFKRNVQINCSNGSDETALIKESDTAEANFSENDVQINRPNGSDEAALIQEGDTAEDNFSENDVETISTVELQKLRKASAEADDLFASYQGTLDRYSAHQLQLEQQVQTLESRLSLHDAGLNVETFLLKNSPAYQHLRKSYETIQKDHRLCAGTLKNLKELQQYVSTMRDGEGPIHVEGYYIGKWNELALRVKLFAGDIAGDTKKWSPTQTEIFLRELTAVSRHGDHTAKVLKRYRSADIQKLFADPRCRTNFYAYLIALFIYDRIFNTFAFGIDITVSNSLLAMESSILEQGTLVKCEVNGRKGIREGFDNSSGYGGCRASTSRKRFGEGQEYRRLCTQENPPSYAS